MEFLYRLFDTHGFPARWHCGPAWYAEPYVGWMHIVSDVITFMAYTAIPCVLAYFVMKRDELVFPTVFWLFAAFIIACGLVHLIEAIIFWEPVYRLSALMKMVTAAVSTLTVIALIRIAPEAIALPGLAQINATLRSEIDSRKQVEDQLKSSNEELQQFTNNVLDREDRVMELKQEVNALLEELGKHPRYEAVQ